MSKKVMLFFEDVEDPSRESVDRRKKEFVADGLLLSEPQQV